MHKHEDPSSDPRSPCEMGEAAKVRNHGALVMRRKAETGEAGWHMERQMRNFAAGWKGRTGTLVSSDRHVPPVACPYPHSHT